MCRPHTTITEKKKKKKKSQVNSWHHKLFHLHSRKCGREEKKLQKLKYLDNEKSFFNEIKNIFYSFWRAVIWWKNKNLIKVILNSIFQTKDHFCIKLPILKILLARYTGPVEVFDGWKFINTILWLWKLRIRENYNI